MRKKLSTEKQSLKAVVDKLNAFGVMCGRDKVSLEEVLDGNFPWTENDSEVGNVYSALSLNCFDTMFNTTDNHADNCNA
jgi:hypothetical protein